MEAVASAAAVVQFIDVAVRLSSALAKVYSDVRDVPGRFQLLHTDLQQQIAVAQDVQTHQHPKFAASVASPAFDVSLLAYVATAENLSSQLEELLNQQNYGRVRRVWKNFCATRKQEEIGWICDRLEQQKTSLSMWLGGANLKLLSHTSPIVDQIMLNSVDTLATVKTIEANSSKATSGTEHISRKVTQLSLSIEGSAQKQDQLIHHISDWAREQELRGLLIAESSQKQDQVMLAITELSRKQDRMIQDIQLLTTHSQPPTQSQPRGIGSLTVIASQHTHLTQTSEAHGAARKCTCRSVCSTQYWRPTSMIRVIQTFRAQHLSYCAEYGNTEQVYTSTIEFLPPPWLSSRTVSLGAQVTNWWSRKPSSIIPIIIGTSRFVDPAKSPAFCAMKVAEKELNTYYRRDSVRSTPIIDGLYTTLWTLFEQGHASALDTDREGRTLLTEVVRIYMWYSTERTAATGDECKRLIELLLDRGADANAISPRPFSTSGPSGTLFDFHGSRLWLSEVKQPSLMAQHKTVFKRLEASGCEFSRPLDTFHDIPYDRAFEREVREFKRFEDQIDICNLGEYVPIILQQDEKRFERTVRRASLQQLERLSPGKLFAPIHFAVLWPPGLKVLLQKGVNVNPEDSLLRRPISIAVALGLVDSAQQLINTDCTLHRPSGKSRRTLLQIALRLPFSERQLMVELIATALADRHLRLLDLARSQLPHPKFSKLCASENHIREQNAPRIIEALASHAVDVPEALQLDGISVYDFVPKSCETYMDMRPQDADTRPQDADTLWNAGFTNIEGPNDNGTTPLLQSMYLANFEMVSWFLGKGASLYSRHRDAPITALHLYAARVGRPKRLYGYDSDPVPIDLQCMAQLHREFGIPHDDCTCPCAPRGCGPINFLFPQGDLYTSKLFKTWLSKVAPPELLLQQYLRDTTRCLLFKYQNGSHTCCLLNDDCRITISTSRPRRCEHFTDHAYFCEQGIPLPASYSGMPRKSIETLIDTLDNLMSHYDDMPERDIMLPEDQPIQYVKWLFTLGRMTRDMTRECNTADKWHMGERWERLPT